jgi:glutathione peroxidase-family protein
VDKQGHAYKRYSPSTLPLDMVGDIEFLLNQP